jgi:multicomponent Na+:H+ antiporter subunit E
MIGRMRQVYAFLAFLVILVREVCLATWAVVKIVLGPKRPIRSGFVAMPLEAESDLEVTVFANSITLTPGTITVHVAPDYDFLVMHALDVGDDPEKLRQATKAVLEKNVLRWTRAAGPPRGETP